MSSPATPRPRAPDPLNPAPARRQSFLIGPTGRAGAEIHLIAPQDLAGHLPSIADVAGRCFTGPPWREPYPAARNVASRMLADSARPGFTSSRCTILAGVPGLA
jgi:hypothetical protein